MYLQAILVAFVCCVIKCFEPCRNGRIRELYSRPGMWGWLKQLIAFLYIKFKLRRYRRKEYCHSTYNPTLYDQPQIQYDDNGINTHAVESMKEITAKNESDAVYFYGFLEKKENVVEDSFVSIKLVRGCSCSYLHLYLYLPGHGILVPKSHPNNSVEKISLEHEKYESTEVSIEILEPMSKWKITYNGLMKSLHCNNNEDSNIHVKFALIWKSYSDYYDTNWDTSPWLRSRSVAHEKWSMHLLKEITTKNPKIVNYAQWGQMRGMLTINQSTNDEVIFRGVRNRSVGLCETFQYQRYLNVYCHLENGMSIYLSIKSNQYHLTHEVSGHIHSINGTTYPVTWTDIRLWKVEDDVANKKKFKFKAAGRRFTCILQQQMNMEYDRKECSECRVIQTLGEIFVNAVRGKTVVEFMKRYKPIHEVHKPTTKTKVCTSAASSDQLVLSFTDECCSNYKLVGGKGTQLAQLTKWREDVRSECTIPSGFCITCKAFEEEVLMNPEVESSLKILKATSCTSVDVDVLKSACEKQQTMVQRLQLKKTFRDEIINKLHELGWIQDDGKLKVKVAVRSSALDEDSSDTSSAGQLVTLLGVADVDKVFEAILSCWSSLFSFNVVQYRRQLGQEVTSQMGVVIQEMVNAPDVSGVIFTMNPLTGHPGEIMINASYGLGESVVSGNVEPDTFVVSRECEQYKIVSQKIGSKLIRMISGAEGGVTTEQLVEKNKPCLSADMVRKLCSIAFEVEKLYTTPRDIEFALSDGVIHLLQSRPITNDVTMTTYELMHEFDSAHTYDNNIFTTANISEMFSGAATPLSLSTFAPAMTLSMAEVLNKGGGIPQTSLYSLPSSAVSQNHMLLSYHHLMLVNCKSNIFGDKHSLDVNVFGRGLHEANQDDIIPLLMNEAGIATRVWRGVRLLIDAYGSGKRFEAVLKKAKNLKFNEASCKTMYKDISNNMDLYFDVWRNYIYYAFQSGISCNALSPVLMQGRGEVTEHIFSDTALILSMCDNVFSAQVPQMLAQVAECIAQNKELKQTFLNSDSEVAINSLISDVGEAGKLFNEFLESHGHRVLREAEMYEKSWGSDPVKLANVLQSTVRANVFKRTNEQLSVTETIEKLQSPLSTTSRLILKKLIPMARKGVQTREYGKSNAIKVSDIFKRAYWKLAELAKAEGILPDKELLFFLTHREIGKVIHLRSTSLVSRARKRRRVHDEKMKLKFPEVSFALPLQPLSPEVNNKAHSNSTTLHGMAVSHGVVEASVRVVSCLQEASNIQVGEILIVHTTDVGWSPYFPLISGLVTEIGGLLSHGAVVAREYGLPCIVSVKGATYQLKSGDFVRLDGGKGEITKLASLGNDLK